MLEEKRGIFCFFANVTFVLQFHFQETEKDLQLQQSSIDLTRENLNSLCRKYHSIELETLGGTVTSLIKKYESLNQLCSRTQANMQESLEKHFLCESSGLLREPLAHSRESFWSLPQFPVMSLAITTLFLYRAFQKVLLPTVHLIAATKQSNLQKENSPLNI